MAGHGSPPPDDRSGDPKRKVGRLHTFQPVGLDLWDPKKFHPEPGAQVRISKSGPGNVGQPGRGFVYVEHPETGESHGLVLRASLQPRKKA